MSYTLNKYIKILKILPGILLTQFCFCQLPIKNQTETKSTNNLFSRKKNIGFEIISSVLPSARITKDEGNYTLRSRIQTAYDAGINYLYNLNGNLIISAGLHFVVGKRNFYLRIPDKDLPGYGGSENPPIVEDKELWHALRIPISIEKKITKAKYNFLFLKFGFDLRYSGIMPDESFGTSILDSSNHYIDVFNSEFSGKNAGKPWITLFCGLSKKILLRNYNLLSLELQADFSSTYFFRGTYFITIPNQPVTSGTYKITGSSVGLSISYILTGTNKRLIHKYQTEKQ